jgi:hypothetical protein
MEQLSTSRESPDSLPLVGYSIDQLVDYCRRQLGYPTWNVELTTQQVLDCINDALSAYSQMRPRLLFGSIRMSKSQHLYLAEQLKDLKILGVANVEFVDTVPAPTEIFYGNLISPAPIIRTGLDEYDLFLRWRKTWQRVTSVAPQWKFDDDRRVLYLHNPLDRYHCGIELHAIYDDTRVLPHIGATWVKKYSLAKSRFLYGDIMLKFSGAIPGPIRDMTLDQGKRADGKADMEKLEAQLFGMQEIVPLQVD